MPIVEFSDRGGAAIGGDHKDTYISTAQPAGNYGGNAYIRSRDLNPSFVRWSLVGHIPTNAIIISAVASFHVVTLGGANNCACHEVLLAWGITPTEEGTVTQNPAINGSVTYGRRIDYNGAGGDQNWTGANFNVAVDALAAEDTQAVAALGAWVNFNIPIMTQRWVRNDANNHGCCFIGSDASVNDFDSQEAVNVADRPYLTVDYTVPESPLQSKIANSMGMGIGF